MWGLFMNILYNFSRYYEKWALMADPCGGIMVTSLLGKTFFIDTNTIVVLRKAYGFL